MPLDLNDIVLGPDDIEPPNKRRSAGNAKPKRSRIAPAEGFSRVFFDWFEDPSFREVYPPVTRLWSVLWYRSGEGQESVRLSAKVVAEARIPLKRRHRYAQQLATAGLIRIDRAGRSEFEVTILARRP
jgi:hypothetical protein